MDWNGIFDTWKTTIITNKRRALSLQEVEFMVNSSLFHCTRSMYHANHAYFKYKFYISLNFSIDILDLDMPFNCNAEISKPFKMKFI